MGMKVEKVTHTAYSATVNTATLFQQNWVIGCSAKGKQRHCTTTVVLVSRQGDIYLRKVCCYTV